VVILLSSLLAVILAVTTQKPEYDSSFDGTARTAPPVSAFFPVFAFLLGFTGLGLEMAVFRILTPVMGLSVYSLAGTLIPFLLGLGLGGILASRWSHKARQVLPWSGLSAAGLLSVLIYTVDIMPGTLVWLSGKMSPSGTTWFALLLARIALAALVLIPGVVAAGTMFPLLMTMAVKKEDADNRLISTIYGINILGSILGPIVMNLVLVERFGVYWTFRILLIPYLALGIWALFRQDNHQKVRVTHLLSSCAACVLILFPYQPDLLNVHAGGYWASHLYNSSVSGPARRLIRSASDERSVLASYDGPVASVLVVDDVRGRSLVIDGKPASNTELDRPTQVMLAKLPLEMDSNIKKVLIIGWGSGQTVNEALKYPVEKVTCVEISREVLKAAAWFSEVNATALVDPRLEVIVDDARRYLSETDEKFDLIISQPSNPWVGFSGNLFTREFLQLSREALTPTGMMTQWFQYYGATESDLDIFLRTFSNTFPVWSLWSPSRGDLVLIGRVTGEGMSESSSRKIQSAPLAVPDTTYLPMGELNTDDRPVLSYSMARHTLTPEPLNLRTYLENRIAKQKVDSVP